jgi:hypothetical protein
VFREGRGRGEDVDGMWGGRRNDKRPLIKIRERGWEKEMKKASEKI